MQAHVDANLLSLNPSFLGAQWKWSIIFVWQSAVEGDVDDCKEVDVSLLY